MAIKLDEIFNRSIWEESRRFEEEFSHKGNSLLIRRNDADKTYNAAVVSFQSFKKDGTPGNWWFNVCLAKKIFELSRRDDFRKCYFVLATKNNGGWFGIDHCTANTFERKIAGKRPYDKDNSKSGCFLVTRSWTAIEPKPDPLEGLI